MTGFSDPASFNALRILPGYEPKYVHLCPLRIDTSFSPPKEIRIYFLSKHSAIDLAIDVLPTPGGPNKHIVLEDTKFFFNFPIDKNSKILLLILSIPK
jgi:hypothetical protein